VIAGKTIFTILLTKIIGDSVLIGKQATIQTLLTTCKLQNVNPYHYLVDVLQRINLHPAREVVELTPRCWKDKFEADPLLSDLARLGKSER